MIFLHSGFHNIIIILTNILNMYDNRFSILIETFKSLPNITTKQAKKILFFLINSDEKFIDDFVNRISIIKKSIHICKYCGNISFDDNICNICSNSNRDKKKTYIVSTIEDLEKIEDTNLYKGTYFVLNEEINIKNNKKLNQNLVKKISNFISTNNVEEITIATD
jgi:recombination protein RecR